MSRRPPRSVLVLRWSHIGDVVLTTPALEALHAAWPKAAIHFATNEGLGVLVRAHPAVSSVIERASGEGDLLFAKRARAAVAPEALLDLHGAMRNAIVRRALLPVGPRAVFRRRPWIDQVGVGWLKMRRYRSKMLIADRYHQAVERLVGRPLERGALRVVPPADAVASAREKMRAVGLDPARPIVGMAPGANFATKRWPIERWSEIATRLRAQGTQVLLTGSAAEGPLAAPILTAAPGTVSMIGALSLGELLAAIAACAAFVANDSGPMHIARALGVPTVAFFGSTDPKQFAFDGHALMWADTDCAPCSLWGLSECPKGHFRCMLDLPVERAWAELSRIVSTGPLRLVHG